MKSSLFSLSELRDNQKQGIIHKMSSLTKDFTASHLRSQITTLQKLLDIIERDAEAEYDYTMDSLSRVEANLRRLRKFLET